MTLALITLTPERIIKIQINCSCSSHNTLLYYTFISNIGGFGTLYKFTARLSTTNTKNVHLSYFEHFFLILLYLKDINV